VKTSFKRKNDISIDIPLELLHINLFGPVRTRSISGNRYVFIIVDDFTRYTRVLFLNLKMKQFMNLQNFQGKLKMKRVFHNKYKEWSWWWIYKWFIWNVLWRKRIPP